MPSPTRRSRKIAAPVVAAPASDPTPETTPVAAPTPDAPPATSARRIAAHGFMFALASLHPALLVNGAPVNGTPLSRGDASRDSATLSPVTFTASDASDLLRRAALYLIHAGIPAAAFPSIDPAACLPPGAFDDLAATYISNRPTATFADGRYAETTRTTACTDADRLYFAVRAAARLTYAARRLLGNASRMPLNGGFGSRDTARAYRDSLATHVATMLSAG